MKLGEIGEDRLIEQLMRGSLSRRDVIAGAGDDCAVVAVPPDRLTLLKTDCVVEGVHFRPNENPAAVGWKAMMRTLSDFAAMSGLPYYALVTLISPADREARWMTQLYRGLRRAANRFDVAIVGGETSATKGPLMVSISAIGSVEKERWVGRSGGKAGDVLFVTGKLGGSGKGRHLKFVPRIHESRWLTRHYRIHAMMDLSDGLGADLPRLAKASGVGFEIDESVIPRGRGCSVTQAINDGEDYELLFALSPDDSSALVNNWQKKFANLPLTKIGRFTRHSEFICRGGPVARHSFHGFVHFQ